MAGAGETKTETSTGKESSGAVASKKMLPGAENPLVIRTDFSDQQAWEAIVKDIRTTRPDGDAYVDLLDDRAFQGLTATQVLGLVSEEYNSQHAFLMVVDHVTISEPEHPIVIVNLLEDDDDDEADEAVKPKEPQRGSQFRAIPAAIQGIENSLTIATMGFEDFADSVDKDGVFRDFHDDEPDADDADDADDSEDSETATQ